MPAGERSAAAIVLGLHSPLAFIGRCNFLAGIALWWDCAMGLAGLHVLWVSMEWLNARVAADIKIFETAASNPDALAELDAMLGRAARTMPARMQGATRLLRYQGLAVTLLTGVTLAGYFVA